MITDRPSRSARSTIAVPSRHASEWSKERSTSPASCASSCAVRSVSVCVIALLGAWDGVRRLRIRLEGCGERIPVVGHQRDGIDGAVDVDGVARRDGSSMAIRVSRTWKPSAPEAEA